DHLDLLVLDRLEQIFGCRTIRNHGFAPVFERAHAAAKLPGTNLVISHPRRRRWRRSHAARTPLSRAIRQLQLWCGPRMIFMAASTCLQVLANSTSPRASRSTAFWAASAMAF